MGVYVVTGGSGGIGGKTVEILRSQGHEVVNVDLKDSDICANLATKEGRDEVIHTIHAQYPDGMVRGGGFDRRAELVIRRQLGLLPPEELRRRCLALGAELLPSNADLCARFPFLPRYPLWLRLWFGDEEFPASGRLFLDESAAHYLTVEDAVTVGGLLLERLAGGPLLG